MVSIHWSYASCASHYWMQSSCSLLWSVLHSFQLKPCRCLMTRETHLRLILGILSMAAHLGWMERKGTIYTDPSGTAGSRSPRRGSHCGGQNPGKKMGRLRKHQDVASMPAPSQDLVHLLTLQRWAASYLCILFHSWLKQLVSSVSHMVEVQLVWKHGLLFSCRAIVCRSSPLAPSPPPPFFPLPHSSSSPLSLQATRTLDGGKKAGKAGTTQLQPSPNVKSTRKCYSQLGEAASSSETEETFPDTLLSNQASGEMEPLQGEA